MITSRTLARAEPGSRKGQAFGRTKAGVEGLEAKGCAGWALASATRAALRMGGETWDTDPLTLVFIS